MFFLLPAIVFARSLCRTRDANARIPEKNLCCASSVRKFRTATRTSATRSGVVQSPSMYDSPIPISAPVKRPHEKSLVVNHRHCAQFCILPPNVYVSSGHTISRYPSRKSRSDSKNIFRACFGTHDS